MKPWLVQGFLLDTLRHFKNMDGQFKIKSYAFCELALLYFPNSTKKSATSQLGRWLRQNKTLQDQLIRYGFKPGRKILTPLQVNIIVKTIGEP